MLEKGPFKHRPTVILEYDRKCRVRGSFRGSFAAGKGITLLLVLRLGRGV